MRRATPPAALAPTAATLVLPWRQDPVIATLTAEILELQTEACRRTSDEVVAIGRRLHAARERLVHGEWIDWIRNAVPFDHHSASRYIRIAKLADDDPDGYQRLRHLGPGKLRVLARLPPERRRALPLGRPLPVDGNRRKPVEVMTVDELAVYLHDPAPLPVRRKPIAELVHDYRDQVADLGDATAQLCARKAEVDAKLARRLHARLRAIVSSLEDAFDL